MSHIVRNVGCKIRSSKHSTANSRKRRCLSSLNNLPKDYNIEDVSLSIEDGDTEDRNTAVSWE